MSRLVSKEYALPFALITSLFFLWGFARSILDVLNKHFQEFLSISISESALVQGTTYLGYFLMAIPAGLIISRGGYRRGIVGGLALFAVGAFLFIPAESARSFQMFLGALFLIGCGLAMLETSANPYATELGDPQTAPSRLNLAQAFNGLGCILGPVIVGGFLFSSRDAHIALPYSLMGAGVIIIAILFLRAPLPAIGDNVGASNAKSEKKSPGKTLLALLSSRRFMAGWGALFSYEIAEISINSLFINYATADGGFSRQGASIFLSFGGLALFMLARVAGSYVMKYIAASKVLTFCSASAALCALTVALNIGPVSTGALLGCYAFEAIIFPTIFALTIIEAQGEVKFASSLLMMTPIGGAVGTLLMGLIAEKVSLSTSFLVPAIAFTPVLFYSLALARRGKSSAK